MSQDPGTPPSPDEGTMLPPPGETAPALPVRYEVRARVPASLARRYEGWLREVHIPDLMATGCFVEAAFSRLRVPAPSPASPSGPDPERPAGSMAGAGEGAEAEEARGDVLFRSAYLAPDQEALDRYLARHAPRLRAHALEHFPQGLRFEREIWEVRERWRDPGETPPDS
jgi:hypothetical protein